MQTICDVATLIGLGSSAVGMTGIVSVDDRRVHVLGAACIATGIATIVAAGLGMTVA